MAKQLTWVSHEKGTYEIEDRATAWKSERDLSLPNGNVIGCNALAGLDEQLGLDLRAALAALAATEGLTPEQLEVAKLEAELEQARVDGVADWSLQFSEDYGWSYNMVRPDGSGSNRLDKDRLEAARAAVAHVRELRAEAEAKRLPDVAGMEWGEIAAEMW